MQNFKMTIQYDGSNFYGWQRLNRRRNVQGTIEKKLSKLLNQKIYIHGASRTDAKAHSYGQVASFKCELIMPFNKFKKVLNDKLPEDIYIKDIQQVDDEFHARYNSKKKRYIYKIYNQKTRQPFLHNYYYHIHYTLDLEKMREAAQYFIGEKDFRSFIVNSSDIDNTIRTIEKIDIVKDKNFIYFIFLGDGFLYKMIRTIVGTILDVGRGNLGLDEINQIFKDQDRQSAKDTVPARGLYLDKVFY